MSAGAEVRPTEVCLGAPFARTPLRAGRRPTRLGPASASESPLARVTRLPARPIPKETAPAGECPRPQSRVLWLGETWPSGTGPGTARWWCREDPQEIADKTQTNTLTPWPALACEKPWLGWFSDLAAMIRQHDRLQFLALATCQAGCRLATDISPRFALVFRESYPAGLQSSSKRDHKAS